ADRRRWPCVRSPRVHPRWLRGQLYVLPAQLPSEWRRADSVAHVDHAVALDDVSATERPELRQLNECGVEPWDFLESTLRPFDHPAGCRVVAGLVPRANEATVLVDLAIREIGAQMPAAP